MTRRELLTALMQVYEECVRLSLAVDEALPSDRDVVLRDRMTALGTCVDDLIDALPTLEDA